jgi:betaine-aldehyde dehydrogenase
VQESIYDEFLKRFTEKLKDIKIGDGMEEGIKMGPLISSSHRDKVENYITIGKNEGAKNFSRRRIVRKMKS